MNKELTIKQQLTNRQNQINALLNGDQKKTKRFMAAALQVSLDKDLMSCSEESVIDSVMKVALLDLNVDKNIGETYLIKYGNTCTMQIGYKGWLKLLSKAGHELRTFPVFKCDTFDCSFNGWDNIFELKPNFDERDVGNFEWEFENLTGVLVVSKDKETGEFKRDFITKKTIEKMRKSSPNQKTDIPAYIWKDWYIDMCCKSAIKKFKNQLVLRDNIDIALALDGTERKIDIEKTKKDGVVIDAEVTEQKTSKPKDLNSLGSQEVKDNTIEIEIEPTSKEKMVKELMDRGATQEQAGKWCYGKDDETLNTYLNDPASIDSALGEAVGA